MWKRIMSFLLVFAMVFCCLTDTSFVFAEETENTSTAKKFEASDILIKNTKSNSEQKPTSGTDGVASWAFDNEEHWWHSRYQNLDQKAEHEVSNGKPSTSNRIWIQTGFDKKWYLDTVEYTGRGNQGLINTYEIWTANLENPTDVPQDSDFKFVQEGKLEILPTTPQPIKLECVTVATHVRIVITDAYDAGDAGAAGGGYVAAKHISFYGYDENPLPDEKADYSRVTEALAGIPEDLGIYTAESVSVVEAARNAVVYDLKLEEQAYVNAMAKAIEDAVEALEVPTKKFDDSSVLIKNAKANSEQNPPRYDNDGYASWAFDNEEHWWHSRYQDTPGEHEVSNGIPSETNPIWIQTGFDKTWYIDSIEYTGRSAGNRIRDYEIKVANLENPTDVPQDSDFVSVKKGKLENENKTHKITLDDITAATHVRIVVTYAHGGSYVVAKNISFYGCDACPFPNELADYSEVTEALAGIPGDLSIYTEETKNAVENAREAVVEGLNITEQVYVDAMAKAIEDAVAGLEYKPIVFDSSILVKNAKANSEQVPAAWTNDGAAAWAFDDEGHWWHTRYQNWDQKGEHEVGSQKGDGKPSSTNPIWIQTGFDTEWYVESIEYTGRDNGHGLIANYEIWAADLSEPTDTPQESDFVYVQSGNLNNTTEKQVITLNHVISATHIRIVVKSVCGGGDGHLAAKKISMVGYGNNPYLNQPADYNAVDEALAKVPTDLSVYTDATRSAVEAAREAVVLGLDVTKQIYVDVMANAVENAVAGLKYRPMPFDSAILIKNAKANSEQVPAAWTDDGAAAWAFDNEGHWWHTRYQNWDQKGEHEIGSKEGDGKPSATNPIWIQTGFDTEWYVESIEYTGRDNGYGLIRDYEIWAANMATPTDTPQESDFVFVQSGNLENTSAKQTITLGNVISATHIRIVVKSVCGGGDGHLAAKKISIVGYNENPTPDQLADYSRVNAAIAAIPTDLSIYTRETADAVVIAKDAVTEGLDVTKQIYVDAMASAIEKTVDELQVEFKFYGSSLSLEDNLSVNFKVSGNELTNAGYENLKVKVVFNEKETTIDSYEVIDGKYVFRFTNIAPQCMNDIMSVTLCGTLNDAEVVSESVDYSIADYCYGILAEYKEKTSEKDNELKVLIVDLLNYGSEAQVYTNYKTDTPANAGLDAEDMAWAKVLASNEVTGLESVTNVKCNENKIENLCVNWYSVALRLNNAVNIRYKIQITDTTNLLDMTMQVKTADGEPVVIKSEDFVDAGNGYYYVYFDKLNAGQMSVPFYATVYEGSTPISNTLSYSVESYVKAKQDDTNVSANLKNLLKEMIKYGYSTNTYAY